MYVHHMDEYEKSSLFSSFFEKNCKIVKWKEFIWNCCVSALLDMEEKHENVDIFQFEIFWIIEAMKGILDWF